MRGEALALEHLAPRWRPWLEQAFGIEAELCAPPPVPVFGAAARSVQRLALLAVKFAENATISARPAWVEPLRRATAHLTVEELFSTYGGYELSRVTMTDGVAVWGPTWVFLGDAVTFRPVDDPRPVHLTPGQMWANADPKVFWHCFPNDALGGFGVFEAGRLVSLAGIRREGEHLLEIGVDSLRSVGTRGYGRAVVSAAGRWILEQGDLIYYTTAPFNVPSARLAKSLGLVHVCSIMLGLPGPYRVPPQPLGAPFSGAELRDYYPAWAMNPDIKPRE
ncbi:MAG: hypothetical protein FJ029_09320 [Actinobacteria bacterium]|nr:hypothetical protein [Actinomycetota bacterium]